MEPENRFLWSQKSLDESIWIRNPSPQEINSDTTHAYASFGNNGTTVSVNAYGHIMQISRYFGYGPSSSGFFCADLDTFEGPFFVQSRTEQLIESSSNPNAGIRLDFIDWPEVLAEPSLGYMYDRWPRFVYQSRLKSAPDHINKDAQTIETFALSIQYFCSDDTVVQQYLINVGEDGIPHSRINLQELSIVPPICLRTLDFTEYRGFDSARIGLNSGDMNVSIVSNSRLVVVHHFPDDMMDQHKSTDEIEEDQKDYPVAVALIVTPLVNNQTTNIDAQFRITIDHVFEPAELEITVTYKLVLLGKTAIQSLNLPTDDDSGDSEEDWDSDDQDLMDSEQVDSETVDNEGDQKMRERREQGDDHPQSELDPKEIVGGDKFDTGTDAAKSSFSTDAKETSELQGVDVSLNEDQEWIDAPLLAKNEMGKEFTEGNQYCKIRFSKSLQLDFTFRRNLEHILSVCCIPIGLLATSDVPEPLNNTANKAGPVAITCGDIAGHRIGPRASLSVMKFLSAMFSYLDSTDVKNQWLHSPHVKWDVVETEQPTHITGVEHRKETTKEEISRVNLPYLKMLRKRVGRVLVGHTYWIAFKAQTKHDEGFSPHYWPTGAPIKNLNWLPPASRVDTPLQLLKMACCHELALWEHKFDDTPEVLTPEMRRRERRRERRRARKHEDTMKGLIGQKLYQPISNWVRELHALNERGAYAFSRGAKRDEEDHEDLKYHLADHVMICLALEFAEDFQRLAIGNLGPYYSYDEVRRQILKRFTTVNPISKQRMLATSRWQDETRFLFHSKDTFLLDAAERHNFFRVRSSREGKNSASDRDTDPWKYADDRWSKLVDAQAYHDEYRHLEWSKPLWYALVLALGVKKRRVSNESVEGLIEKTLTALLSLCSNSGLFPGQLGPNRVAMVFTDELSRDNYWHSVSEIPYVLWTYCNTETTHTVVKKPKDSQTTTNAALGNSYATKDAVRIGQQIEKTVPFVNLSHALGQSGEVVVLDDWLQDAPATLDFGTKWLLPSEDSESMESIDQDLEAESGNIWHSYFWKRRANIVGVVIDIPRFSTGTEISAKQVGLEQLSKALERKRTVFESKKRIIWLPNSSLEAAKRCFDTCSGIEKENVLSFLRRHVNRETRFLDSSTAALNEWETELHLSFFRVSEVEDGSLHKLKDGKYLSSATMSFRFVGHFSDRYWTCYFLEHDSNQKRSDSLGDRLQPSKESGIGSILELTMEHAPTELVERQEKRRNERFSKSPEKNQRSWQQRKVLELLIYNQMLSAVYNEAKRVFRSVKDLALQPRGDEDPNARYNPFKRAIEEATQLQHLGDKEGYFPIADLWRKYIQILLVIEDNLTDNLDRMKEWGRREEDRRNQRPRWTQRDEQTHFTTILRLTITSQRKVSDIQRLKGSIQSFRESLPSQLESIRDDIGFRGSQSINLFTYVTVVFLPLGFATGVLSMSELPNRSTLIHLVTLAFGALGITFFALLNAESVKKVIIPMVKQYRRATKLMFKSIIYLLWISVFAPLLRLFVKHKHIHAQQPETTKEKVRGRWSKQYKTIVSFQFREAWRQELKGRNVKTPNDGNDKNPQPKPEPTGSKVNGGDGANMV